MKNYLKELSIILFCLICFSGISGAGVTGDINGDGKVDMNEAIFVLQSAAGKYSNQDPSCALTGKGSWQSGTSYLECDVIEYDDLYYICIDSHTSSSTSSPSNTSYWEVLTLAKDSFWKSGDSDTFFTAEGVTIGIGTGTPDSALHVVSDSEKVVNMHNPSGDMQLNLQSGGDGEVYIQYSNIDTDTSEKDDAWMVGMDDEEDFRFAFGSKGEIRDSNSLIKIDQNGNMDIAGALKLPGHDGPVTLISNDDNLQGDPGADGFRIIWDAHFFGNDNDALVFEKTDHNQTDPDAGASGIVFVNTGSDGEQEVAMAIKGDGSIGIGTKKPEATLEVNGDIQVGTIKDEDTEEAGYGNLLFFSGGSDWGSFDSDNSDQFWIGRYNVDDNVSEFRVGVGDDNIYSERYDKFVVGMHANGDPGSGTWYPRLTVISEGNVGIGTSEPQSRLHVVGDDERVASFFRDGDCQVNLESGKGYETYIQYANTDAGSDAWMVGMDDEEDFRFAYGEKAEITDAKTLVKLNQNGNMEIEQSLSIGTSDPARRLHVRAQTYDPQIRLQDGNGSWELQGGRNFHILKGTAGDDTRFFIEDSGDIGIGTTSPDEKFHVDGNIIAEGDIIATGSFKVNGQALNVPDYVFDSDYDLMALNEIELFIEDNGHLPDIPSAQEVKSEGLDVSITLMKLLAKI
jgi:hypothetical protein